MIELSPEKVYARKIAQAYVALALAQDEATRYVSEHSAHALHPMLTTLHVTAELLEEVLQNVLPEEGPTQSLVITSSEMLM